MPEVCGLEGIDTTEMLSHCAKPRRGFILLTPDEHSVIWGDAEPLSLLRGAGYTCAEALGKPTAEATSHSRRKNYYNLIKISLHIFRKKLYFCSQKSIGEQSSTDIHNLAMTFLASQPVDFFFLCFYGCNAILYFLS